MKADCYIVELMAEFTGFASNMGVVMDGWPCKLRELDSGEWCYLIDAKVFHNDSPSPEDAPCDGNLGMLCKDLQERAARGDSTLIAQFFGLVVPGTILARHIFKGLERPLLADGDDHADKCKFVYTRKPAYDYIWIGEKEGKMRSQDVPIGCVFAVYVTPNVKHKDQFPEISGWIDHWAWLEEDSGLPEATDGWIDRYDMKVWTREQQ